MASQKRARTASGKANSGGTATRPGSGNGSRNGGGRTASSGAVRSGKPTRTGAGQNGRNQNGRGPGGAQGGQAQGGGQGARAQTAAKGNRSGGRPGQAGSNAASARAGILTADPSAEAASGRYVPLWLQLTTLVLSLAGLGVSIYLTIAHYTSSSILTCPDKGFINCAKVTTSPESVVFGVFPVAVLGLAFYVFMVAVNTPWGWAWSARLPIIWWARLGSIVVGIGFVLYLLYAEIVEIGNICLWCTSIHVMTFLLFVLLIFAASIGTTTIPAAGTPLTTKPAR